ncbi:LCP family protein [Actinomadura graeca]|uniref:LCP family protein n=1 Tax=Actinomadura graeca TaxID=2750812 RepID=A0ABX8QT18_9ACTN|nr:LCP family protein [Actinomadura graeca]QXJ21887.1 LCP family protein [Actinomadura graeca]
MDDLELLRALGRDLEEEPPGSLAGQRRRLTGEAGGAAGGRRRPGLRAPGRWTALAAVAAVTAALALMPALVLGGHGEAVPGGSGRTAIATGRALNVLFVGADGRGTAPARSDTLVLVHLPADRAKARVVSIPRDSLVWFPACEVPGGKVVPPHRGPIDQAFSLGAGCARTTVESLTGVRIDTTVVIGFGGFAQMVDAVGGVEMTLPKAVRDPAPGLSAPAGRVRLDGAAALAYVRAGHGRGDGSELSRIERQQRFMAALLRQAHDLRLRSPVRYTKFLAVSAASVATYPRLDVRALQAVARGMDETGPAAVTFDTVPVRPAREDPGGLAWDRPAADRLFSQFRE